MSSTTSEFYALETTNYIRTISNPERQEAALKRLNIIKIATLICQVTLFCFLLLAEPTFASLLLLPVITLVTEVMLVSLNIEQLVKKPGMLASHPNGHVVPVHFNSYALINQVGKETIFLSSLMNFLDRETSCDWITNLLRRLHKL